jgi:hypothetical protein
VLVSKRLAKAQLSQCSQWGLVAAPPVGTPEVADALSLSGSGFFALLSNNATSPEKTGHHLDESLVYPVTTRYNYQIRNRLGRVPGG